MAEKTCGGSDDRFAGKTIRKFLAVKCIADICEAHHFILVENVSESLPKDRKIRQVQ